MKTALEFYNEYTSPRKGYSIEMVMKEFAKLHVEAALESAANIADEWENSGELAPILKNAYPLTNIT